MGKKKNLQVQILLQVGSEEGFMLLTHRIVQTSPFWPRCCSCLVTPDATFWKREEIPPNPLIYVWKTRWIWKKNITPSSSLRAETGRRVGAKAAGSKTFPRRFGTASGRSGGKNGFKKCRFSPKIEWWPPRFTQVGGNSILLLERWFLPDTVYLCGKMVESYPKGAMGEGSSAKTQHILGFF